MATARNTACCLLAVLLAGATTVAESAARPGHHGHTHRHGHNTLQSQTQAPPNQSNSAPNLRSGKGPAKPDSQGPSTNTHGVQTPNGGVVSNQDGAGRDSKQNTKGERPQSNAVETTNGSTGRAAGSPDVHMNDLGPVDTHITVQPRLHGPNRSDVGESKDKTKPHALTSLGTHPPFVRPHQSETIHNAIGVPVPRDARGSGRDSDARSHTVSLGVAPPGRDAALGIGSAAVSPAKPTISQPTHGALTPATPSSGQATVNGTGFRRHGYAPATVGGSIKTASGISGSMIRPKH
jgi:hypothetical protein